MAIEDAILEKLRELRPADQEEVLHFVERLQEESARKQPRPSMLGRFVHLSVYITRDDIAEARREMWGNFPREGMS